MANTATVSESGALTGFCAGDADHDAIKMAIVQLSLDDNYVQGGYTLSSIAALAALGDIVAVLPQGPIFHDTVGGDALIVSYYPSTGKLQLYRVTEAVAGTNLIEEYTAGALPATPMKLNAVVFYR